VGAGEGYSLSSGVGPQTNFLILSFEMLELLCILDSEGGRCATIIMMFMTD